MWPFSITDLLNECLHECAAGHTLSKALRLVIELLPDVPDETVCEAVADNERLVQRGNYENVVNTQAKFAQAEMALKADPVFQSDWQRMKEHFDVKAGQDHKGVLRRTMGAERNMRPEFSVNMKNPHEAFRLAYDAFCQRWNLYGMMHDEPLLLKLAVNVTPHGTMILIPSFYLLSHPIFKCVIAKVSAKASGLKDIKNALGKSDMTESIFLIKEKAVYHHLDIAKWMTIEDLESLLPKGMIEISELSGGKVFQKKEKDYEFFLLKLSLITTKNKFHRLIILMLR